MSACAAKRPWRKEEAEEEEEGEKGRNELGRWSALGCLKPSAPPRQTPTIRFGTAA